MASDSETRGDMQAHESGYAKFTAMMKWGTIVSLVVAFLVILLISS